MDDDTSGLADGPVASGMHGGDGLFPEGRSLCGDFFPNKRTAVPYGDRDRSGSTGAARNRRQFSVEFESERAADRAEHHHGIQPRPRRDRYVSNGRWTGAAIQREFVRELPRVSRGRWIKSPEQSLVLDRK